MDYQLINISEQQASEYALQFFGINGTAKKLAGEEDFNFYIKSEKGEFTLKVSRPNADLENIQLQAAVMNWLEQKQIPRSIPSVVKSLDGNEVVELESQRYLRLQKWVSGSMLADANPRTENLLQDWGKTCGLLSKNLQGFDHPAARRFYKWNPSETLYSKKFKEYIATEEQQSIADYFWNLFEKEALPKLPNLRKSVNYSDAHEYNLIINSDRQNPQITGVIDFGDVIFSETVNELAIGCAYACMTMPDPLEAAKQVVKGYHSVFPLREEELEILFQMIAARLMITAANAAWNKHNEPDNEYLLISEKPAWELLKKWRAIPPALAHYSFRHACGLEPCPKNLQFQLWANEVHDIIDLAGKKITYLNLSVGSLDLGNNSNYDSNNQFEKTIQKILQDNDAAIGIGGYCETRPFYSSDAYLVEGNQGAQWRTTHIGFDVWASVNTPVFAPLDAKIHSFQDNAADCDYGPTIILKHEIEGENFYTLYGHLSPESLSGLEKGMTISKGQKIAEIGAAPVNGNWPPHLHFQVILDMLGKEGDFPGVAFPHEIEVWKSICPDPTVFFTKLKNVLKDDLVRTKKTLLESRKNHLGYSLSLSYKEPLHIVRGYKQYLYDVNGRRYLDTANNVPHVGHQHPRVVAAAKRQVEVLNTNTRYLHDNIVQFAEELTATFPPELSVIHFVNSGSEANELALRMAYTWSGQKDMIAVEVGYHGNTNACIDVSSYKFDGKGGKGCPETTHIVPMPDPFRGKYRGKNTGEKYATHINEAIENVKSKGRNIAGFICESILSCCGQIVLPKGYLKVAYEQVRAAGGLCIADEVQVGFGRVGDKFWGFELQGVVPDIVTMGKPIGNGHPLAAVITTPAVAEAFANGMEFFNTFGGNPVSCAIGREVLQIVKDENLQEHALEVGEYLKSQLRNLQSKYPIIGDVRGHGLFLGFELIKNQETLEPAAEQTSYLANRMKERGILMGTDGRDHNVIKIKPPLCFDKSNADFLIENLDKVLEERFMQL